MKDNKGFAIIIIVFIVVSVLALGGGTYYFLENKTPWSTEITALVPAPTHTTTTTPINVPNTGEYGINEIPTHSAATSQNTVSGISAQILNLQEKLNNTRDVSARDSLTLQITKLKAQMEVLAKAGQSKITQNSLSITSAVPNITSPNLAMDCNQNKFSAAFVLVSPDPNDQKTKEFSIFLEDLRGKFEQAFKDATYDLATMKVEDIFITKTGSEDYINNPNQIVLSNVTKDLISKNGDKYNFVYVFTTYDPKTNAWFHIRTRSNIKNIGYRTSDKLPYYGSSGNLLGISFMGDFLSEYKKTLNQPHTLARQLPTDAPFGINLLIHETGHQWCCQLGDKFLGNGDISKIEIIGLDGSHTYRGLEAPAKTQDPMFGSRPWVLDENSGTYFLEKAITISGFGTNSDYASFGFNYSTDMDLAYEHYPIRYHPITLYAMGLLPKDQYSKEFNIVDAKEEVGGLKVTDVKKYSKISVNDIIKIFGERACVQ